MPLASSSGTRKHTAFTSWDPDPRVRTPTGIYKAVMDIPDFTKADQMFCLNFFMLHKGVAKGFMEMSEQDKEYWMRDHLALHNFGG